MKITKKEIFIVIILVFTALTRFLFFLPKPPDYTSALDKQVTIDGVVSNPPDVRLSSARITITPTNQTTSILVIVDYPYIGPDINYDDKVRVSGLLTTPENFITSSGKEFNYNRYLANQDIYYIIKNAKIETLSVGYGNRLIFYLYKFRDMFIKNISRVIAPPESDLANGLILGIRGGFDNDMRNQFITTGTIHIIALSGYNVTVVAEGVMSVIGLLMVQSMSIIFGIIFIFLFIIMAGASSTAIRAGIMATIALFAKMTGRLYNAGRSLVIAGLLMVVYDPRVISDISFQLSFLATFGVLFITPKVIKWVWFLPMRFGLRELTATTLGATIAVLPILLQATGILSLVSLPANILILPFIPITMFLIFLTGVVGFFSTGLSILFAYLSHLLLSYILSIIHYMSLLPFASITISSFPIILTIILYGVIFWWSLIKKH